MLAGQEEGTTLAVAQFSIMSGPLGLLICCIAMVLRSGAAIWLLGTQLFFIATPMLIATSDDRIIFATMAMITVCVVTIIAAIFAFLVSRQELRAP
jgi:hypothetical protein